MGIQTQYPEQLDVGFEGGFADLQVKVCVTGVNESEAMPFGRAVQFDASGSNDRSVKLMDGATPAIQGITGLSHFHESFDESLTGVAQVSTITVGGTPVDGTYSFDIEGTTISVVRTGGSPSTNNDIAAAFRTAVNNDPNVSLIVTAAGAGADVVITKDTPGSFSVANLVAPGTGTLVHALTTGGEADGVKQNEEANVLRKGTIWVRPEDAVTPASGVHVRITANAGVGTALGAFRGSADGGNTVDISSKARWVTSSVDGAENGLAKLEVNFE